MPMEYLAIDGQQPTEYIEKENVLEFVQITNFYLVAALMDS